MIRTIVEEGNLYVCADDLATVILNISEGLAEDPALSLVEQKISSYVTERLALSIVGGNLAQVNIVGDSFEE